MAAEYNGVSDGAGAALEARLAVGVPLLLDGATGTELEERGVDCGLPLWSAGGIVRAPEVLLQITRSSSATGPRSRKTSTAVSSGRYKPSSRSSRSSIPTAEWSACLQAPQNST